MGRDSPTIVGGGRRWLPDDLRLPLRLLDERRFANDVVYLHKVAAAADLWVPAVNHWGGLGRWAFLEVSHMENAADLIRARFLMPAGARA